MEQTLMDKLTILADSAKYDVACTSSGASRTARPGTVGCGCCGANTALGATSTPRLFRAQARSFCSSWGIWPTV